MPDTDEHHPPEVLKAIQAAERKVERMLRSAEREAAATLERARVQTEAVVAEKRQSLEQKKQNLLAETAAEAEREAERIVLEARVIANDFKARCQARLDEVADLVLQRILLICSDRLSASGTPSTSDDDPPLGHE